MKKVVLFTLIFISIGLGVNSQELDIVWEKTYTFPENSGVNDAIYTSDNHILLVGFHFADALGLGDVLVIKMDTLGDTIWTKTIGYLDSIFEMNDVATGIIETYDNNYAIVCILQELGHLGECFGSVKLIKMNPNGDIIWENDYTNCNLENGYMFTYDFTQTTDSSFIISGEYYSSGDCSAFMLKANRYGDSLWTTTLPLYSTMDGYGCNVVPLEDGRVLSVFRLRHNDNQIESTFVWCADSSGDLAWIKSYPIAESYECTPNIITTNNGLFLISDVSSDDQILFYWMDENGVIQDSSKFGNPETNSYYLINYVYQTNDNGYLMTGGSEYNLFIAKINSVGDSVWSKIYHHEKQRPGYFIHQSGNGDILVAGRDGIDGTFIMKLRENPLHAEIDDKGNLPDDYQISQNYPNPFNPSTIIEYSIKSRGKVNIEIFNSLGQKIKTLINEIKPVGEYSVIWNGTDFAGNRVASGIYFYQISIDDYVESRKMVLLK